MTYSFNCTNDKLMQDFKATAEGYGISSSSLLTRLVYLFLINYNNIGCDVFLPFSLQGVVDYGHCVRENKSKGETL